MVRSFLKWLVYALIPKSLFLVRCPVKEKSIYLTFDDGPSPEYTGQLLDLLDRHNAKGTFFVIGQALETNKPLGERIVNSGHSLGNHSYSHKGFGKLPLKDQVWQVTEADRVISELDNTGRKKLFRAPQGSWNFLLVLSLAFRKFKCVHWSYDTVDFSDVSVEQMVSTFKSRPVQAGEVILFHDDSDKCIEVLATMLPIWSKQGYLFDAL
jgi:peptidoglycan/xylan/chitin deacetylase (PgdA/CDA1 family)